MNDRKIIQKAKRSVVYNMFGERRCITVRVRIEDKIPDDIWCWVKPPAYSFEQDGYLFTVLVEKAHYIQHTVKEVKKNYKGKEFKIIPHYVSKKHPSELDILWNKKEKTESEWNRLFELQDIQALIREKEYQFYISNK